MPTRLTLMLTEQIPSGKNQVRKVFDRMGRARLIPNDRFVQWRAGAAREIQRQRKTWPAHDKMATPLRGRLKLVVRYQPRDKRKRDMPGMLDALCHLLEWAELIEDDSQIRELDWWTFTDVTFLDSDVSCAILVLED